MSIDALFTGGPLQNAVADSLQEHGAEADFTLLASHTHYAPGLDSEKPLLGSTDPAYVREVATLVSATIREVLADGPQRCEAVRLGSGQADHSINRRKVRWLTLGRATKGLGKVVLSPAPGGPRDETLSTLMFTGDHGPIGVLWNYACHPVSYPDPATQTPHFIGVVRDRIRNSLGLPTLPVLFAQGFSGDIRPRHASTLQPRNKGVRRLRMGPDFSDFTRSGYEQWSMTLGERVVRTMLQSKPISDIESSWRTLQLSTGDLFVTDDLLKLNFSRISVGPALIVTAPAEPVVAYGLWLRSQAPGRQIMPTGCADRVAGYVPTGGMLKQGGYEVQGFCQRFGVRAVRPDVEKNLRQVLLDLLG